MLCLAFLHFIRIIHLSALHVGFLEKEFYDCKNFRTAMYGRGICAGMNLTKCKNLCRKFQQLVSKVGTSKLFL